MYKLILQHPTFDLQIALIAGAFVFAMWKGFRPEKVGGTLNLAAGVIATAFMLLLKSDLQPVALLLVDAALSVGFLYLAIRYASLWLGAALLLQAIQFSLHAYYFVLGSLHDRNYIIVNNIVTVGINVAIIVGTILAWRRRVRERREGLAYA